MTCQCWPRQSAQLQQMQVSMRQPHSRGQFTGCHSCDHLRPHSDLTTHHSCPSLMAGCGLAWEVVRFCVAGPGRTTPASISGATLPHHPPTEATTSTSTTFTTSTTTSTTTTSITEKKKAMPDVQCCSAMRELCGELAWPGAGPGLALQ